VIASEEMSIDPDNNMLCSADAGVGKVAGILNPEAI